MIGQVEGGEFKTVIGGDDRDATIAEIALPYWFELSKREVVIMELEQVKKAIDLICMNEDEESGEACLILEHAISGTGRHIKVT